MDHLRVSHRRRTVVLYEALFHADHVLLGPTGIERWLFAGARGLRDRRRERRVASHWRRHRETQGTDLLYGHGEEI